MLVATAAPIPVVSAVSFIPSTKPGDTDPPELILSFSVRVAPPTNVTCQVDSTPMDVSDLSREVTYGEYLPLNPTSPVTNVTVTLRTRQAGDYQCNVSVLRASMTNTTDYLTDATTSPVSISGRVAITLSVNINETKVLYFVPNSDRHTH